MTTRGGFSTYRGRSSRGVRPPRYGLPASPGRRSRGHESRGDARAQALAARVQRRAAEGGGQARGGY